MTEEIIVDGVNVAGCDRHCSDNHNVPNRCYSDINESYRDCKPKEYQCNFYVNYLEQEVKHWQMECREAKAKGEWTYDLVRKKVNRLEQENKELREENRYYKAELKLSCNELDKSNNWEIAERQEKNKYRSALEEIRILATKNVSIENFVKIQNKINEVLQ